MWLLFERAVGEPGAPLLVPLSQGCLTVGRGAGCSVIVCDDLVSSVHLTVVRRGDAVEFRDEGSSAGTLHRGAPAVAGTLEPGDVLQLGGTRLRLVDVLPSPTRVGAVERAGGAPTVDWGRFGRFLRVLRETAEPRVLLERLLEGAIETFGVQRGFVLLSLTKGGGVVPVAARGIEESTELVEVSRTLTNRAMSTGATVVIESTVEDPSCALVKSVQFSTPRSVIVAPLSSGGRTFGAVYLDAVGRGAFSREQIPLIEGIAGFVGELLAAADVRSTLVATRDRLHRFQAMAAPESPVLLGVSAASRETQRLIEVAAGQDVSVLLTGETGTGKEVAARLLHGSSRRAAGPFVSVNCAALPHDIIEAELFGAEKGAFTGAAERRLGRFELATGGTLFLDEVGELPVELQVKLLRVLQERRVQRLGGTNEVPLDFRLVCATNADPEAAVRDGHLREDFYYRINVFRVRLQPLRVRTDDILPLVRHFLALFATKFGKVLDGVSAEAEEVLLRYPWPGNVRELRNCLETACLVETSSRLQTSSIPVVPSSLPVGAGASGGDDAFWGTLPRNFQVAIEAFEQAFLRRMFDFFEGNVTTMARETGMTRNAIYRRFRKYGLGRPRG